MSIFVICPSCNEKNLEGALSCIKCQASLMGVPRQQPPETGFSGQNRELQAGNAAVGQAVPMQPDGSIISGYATMLERIRSWGLWSLGLGALHIFTSGFLSAPWGILLILVGLASFYFRSASMFIIYAITLAWAAFSNVTSASVGWMVFAIYQFYLAFRVFQQYRLFRDIEAGYNAYPKDTLTSGELPSSRASRAFPWLGSLFGCSSIVGFVLMTLAILILVIGSEGQAATPDYFGFIEGMLVNLGVLAIAISLSSLLSRYQRKALSIIGLIAGILTVVIELAFVFLL